MHKIQRHTCKEILEVLWDLQEILEVLSKVGIHPSPLYLLEKTLFSDFGATIQISGTKNQIYSAKNKIYAPKLKYVAPKIKYLTPNSEK